MTTHRRAADWVTRHPVVFDLLFAALLWFAFVTTFAGVANVPEALLNTAAVAAWAIRRWKPVLSLFALIVVALLTWSLGLPPFIVGIFVGLELYSTALRAPMWAARTGLGVGLLGAVLVGLPFYTERWTATGTHDGKGVVPALFVGLFMMLGAGLYALFFWVLGDLARTRRLHLIALEDGYRRLHRERDQERALAAADERTHIAREMHDIVAHSLTVIITQADGGRYASRNDPAVAEQTLATIAETGRSSLQEMRRLIGVLRTERDTGTAPLPTLDDIDGLVATMNTAGLNVVVERVGTPRRDFPSGASLTAYRVAQEALTNVLRHAGPHATATITLQYTFTGLTMTISDDGRGSHADASTAGSGQGLRGMAERLALYNGTLTTDATRDGFTVRASLPYAQN